MMDATTCKGMLRRLQDGENCEAVDADLSSRFYCRHGQPWSNHQGLPVDKAAMKLLPTDVLEDYTALSVIGDGSCLFRAASLLMAGHEGNHIELRLRASLELGMHVGTGEFVNLEL